MQESGREKLVGSGRWKMSERRGEIRVAWVRLWCVCVVVRVV